MPFNAAAPLPGPPDPWEPSRMPERRARPPFLMSDMIAAEPALAERLVGRLGADASVASLADAVRATAEAQEPVLTTGCGTSEHAALVAAGMLRDALRRSGLPADRVAGVQAFELAWDVPARGVLIAVSHEGGTWATNLALERGRASGMTTALITVGGGSPGAALADHRVLTEEQDQSWCHTVGYLSPLVASAVLAAAIRGELLDPGAAGGLLADSYREEPAEAAADRLSRCARLLTVGSGVDHAAARELALKVEEGAHLPATPHQLETVRHGHLAAADGSTGLVLLLTDGEQRGSELVDRVASVLRAAREIGMPAAAILADDLQEQVSPELTPAGRLTVAMHRLPRLPAAAIGSAIPLQLLTERLARARGVNPDTLGREDPRQAAAADA